MTTGRVWHDRPSKHDFLDGGEPGPCSYCGRDLKPASEHRRRYCSKACRAAVARLELAEREATRAAAPAGACVACGAPIEPVVVWACPSRRRYPELASMRRASPGVVRFDADAWAWLAPKLGLEPDDERVPEAALRLAEAGRLHVFVSSRGVPIAVAKAASA